MISATLALLSVLARLAVCLTTPQAEPVRDRCDAVEVNHFYDDEGRPVFTQLILVDRNAQGGWDVVAWRMVKSPDQWPQADHMRGGYVIVWQDGDYFREVRTPFMAESFTQFDPELAAREWLPDNQRRGLGVPKVGRGK
jgi:hypothetical protein